MTQLILVPRFTVDNSLEIVSDFLIDKYFDKELFCGLHLGGINISSL
jgi:hypothetical protein